MAAKKKSPPFCSSPIPIGNCEVVVDAEAFTSKSTQNTLQISVSRKSKISISVKEVKTCETHCNKSRSRAEDCFGGDVSSSSEDRFYFLLINPKDADGLSKALLQEALTLYTKELPAMSYASNTGKESMFLERCVLKGKYCSLLLISESLEGSRKVIAAISYQIIPADTQFAEIPLAAVLSDYQCKGIGRLVSMELRKRLQGVGIQTILCWGDKESEGFWVKQGFITVAKVDMKGRTRRLPIKADIRRALCFPGGSTLMISHLQKDSTEDTVKLSIPLRPHVNTSSAVLVAVTEMSAKAEKSQPEQILEEHSSLAGSRQKASQAREEMIPFEVAVCHDVASSLESNRAVAAIELKNHSCSDNQGLKRVWEASLSSLKSKRVKGGPWLERHQDSKGDFCFDGDGKINSCFKGCFLGTCRSTSLVENTPAEPSTNRFTEKSSAHFDPANDASMEQPSRGTVAARECFKIMLMNIADETKRLYLKKIIEDLGGTVTSDGRESTHVITGQVRKTLNFCIALCSGAWIVSPSWLKESFREGKFLDESPFILHDEDYRLKYQKELKDAVFEAKAKPGALLKCYDLCIPAHVHPPANNLSAIATSAGANVIKGLGEVNEVRRTIFVACEEDMEEALLALRRGIRTFSSDWLINCVMRQELDLEGPQFAESL